MNHSCSPNCEVVQVCQGQGAQAHDRYRQLTTGWDEQPMRAHVHTHSCAHMCTHMAGACSSNVHAHTCSNTHTHGRRMLIAFRTAEDIQPGEHLTFLYW